MPLPLFVFLPFASAFFFFFSSLFPFLFLNFRFQQQGLRAQLICRLDDAVVAGEYALNALQGWKDPQMCASVALYCFAALSNCAIPALEEEAKAARALGYSQFDESEARHPPRPLLLPVARCL